MAGRAALDREIVWVRIPVSERKGVARKQSAPGNAGEVAGSSVRPPAPTTRRAYDRRTPTHRAAGTSRRYHMRLPHVRGYEPIEIHSRAEKRYRIDLWEQPLHRWLIARVYHWYDMQVCRVPGFKLAENLWDWRHRNHAWHEYLPLSAAQDIRCYYLGVRDRTVLATLDVPADTYERVTGKT